MQFNPGTKAVKHTESETETTLQAKARPLTPSEERRKECIQRVNQYHQQGWTQKDIADLLNIHPKAVRRYLHATYPQVRRQRTSRLSDHFKPYLLWRRNEGCHIAAKLYWGIRSQGLLGCEEIVRNYIQ